MTDRRERTLGWLLKDGGKQLQARSLLRLSFAWLGIVLLSLGLFCFGSLAAATTAPTVISAVNPEYTKEARSKKITGKCLLSAVIDKDGTPQDIAVVTSVAEGVAPKLREVAATLDGQAVKALQQYRFHPALKDGMPVASKIRILVNFQLF